MKSVKLLPNMLLFQWLVFYNYEIFLSVIIHVKFMWYGVLASFVSYLSRHLTHQTSPLGWPFTTTPRASECGNSSELAWRGADIQPFPISITPLGVTAEGLWMRVEAGECMCVCLGGGILRYTLARRSLTGRGEAVVAWRSVSLQNGWTNAMPFAWRGVFVNDRLYKNIKMLHPRWQI